MVADRWLANSGHFYGANLGSFSGRYYSRHTAGHYLRISVHKLFVLGLWFELGLVVRVKVRVRVSVMDLSTRWSRFLDIALGRYHKEPMQMAAQ